MSRIQTQWSTVVNKLICILLVLYPFFHPSIHLQYPLLCLVETNNRKTSSSLFPPFQWMSLEMSERDPPLCPDWLCARHASLSLCCRASVEAQTALHDRHNKLPACLLARLCRAEPRFPRTACEKLDVRTSCCLGNNLLTGRDKGSPAHYYHHPFIFFIISTIYTAVYLSSVLSYQTKSLHIKIFSLIHFFSEDFAHYILELNDH